MAFPKKIWKRLLKWIGFIILSLVVILIAVWLILQTQWGQNFVKKQAVNYLSKKLHTTIVIGSIHTDWLNHFEIKNFYVLDQQRRTLCAGRSLDLTYELWDILFHKKITISDIALDSVQINLIRDRKDSLFNFSFIPAAFAGKSSEPVAPTGDSSYYSFNLGTLQLTNTSFVMNDAYGGQKYALYAGYIKSYVKNMDFDKMIFKVKYFITDSVNAKIDLSAPYKTQVADTSTASILPFISTDSLRIANTDFEMENMDDNYLHVKTIAGLLSGNNIMCDLNKMTATANSLQLLDHTSNVTIKSNDKINGGISPIDTTATFTYAVNKITIERNNFSFDDDSKPKTGAKEMDFHHLLFQQLNIHADSVGYDGNAYSANIKQMNVDEKCGFRIKQLATNARYTDTSVVLKNLDLQTEKNTIYGDALVAYPSIDAITKQPGKTSISANIRSNQLLLDELLYFQPALAGNASFKPLLGKTFSLNTSVSGSLNKLHIPSFYIQQGITKLLASADVLNLPDYKKLYILLSLKEFTSTRDALLSFLPKNTIPDSLLHYIPERFSITGTYKGTLDNMYTDLKINSSIGNASIKGTLKNITDKQKATYDLAINTDKLLLDKIMQDTSYGASSVHMNIKGQGYDPASMDASFSGHIDAFVYNKYDYHDVQLNGTIASNTIDAHLQSDDPNLQLTTDTHYDMSQHNGAFTTNTNIGRIDLRALGFLTDSLIVSGNINADFPVFDTSKLEGNFIASNLTLLLGSKAYILDSITLNAKNISDTETIVINTPLFSSTLKGQFSLQSIPAAAKVIANKYLYTKTVDSAYPKKAVVTIEGRAHIPDSLFGLIPGLKKLTPFDFALKLDTDSSMLTFGILIDSVIYQDYEMDSIFLMGSNVRQFSDNRLFYTIGINHIQSPSFFLPLTLTVGTVNSGQIDGTLGLFDENLEPRYKIGYHVTNDPVHPYLRFKDSLVIDRKSWVVNDSNIIYFNTKQLQGSNLVISRGNESLSLIANKSTRSGLPLKLTLSQFRLRNITDIIMSDTAFVDGIASGDVTLENIDTLKFTSDLIIDSLRFKEVNVGKLTARVLNNGPDNLDANIFLTGNKNDVALTGTYNTSNTYADFNLRVGNFNLQNVQPFAEKYISELNGGLNGNISIIRNSTRALDILGSLQFDNAEGMYKEYATLVKIPNGELVFGSHDLTLNNFTITDSAGNKGQLTGRLLESPGGLAYDLRLRLDNFRAIGYRRFPDQTIFGPTNINANLVIKGEFFTPKIDGTIRVVDNSAFTYVYIPEDDKSARGQGLIEFFDPSKPIDTATVIQRKKFVNRGSVPDVNVSINVTPKSTVTIVLDELSGDHIIINGTADLDYDMHSNGQSSLTGIYTAEGGEYELSISNIIRKKFAIEKGSTIAWSGDPLKADMNLTASYKTRTSAGELVNDVQDVPGIDRQKLEFEVYLFLKGALLQPDISFKIEMPEEEQGVFNGIIYTRIKQVNETEGELNKQVMGLLVLNHFIADNPFNSLVSGNFETQAYSTAGNLLTQQLTNLLGDVIKGVDLDLQLDVHDDYTKGEAQRQTNLKVHMSKTLANNRLTIYVGSTFALEGHYQNTNSLSGIADDVSAEYLLTTDGRYRIKVYNINTDELTFQGSIVKTGLTFAVVLEFNRFRDMFKSKKRRTKSK